jgi:geranylgeranyl diphosphate synthase type II
VVDIQSEGKKDVNVETLQWIHEHKTAALLEFCVVGGGILGGANEEEVVGFGVGDGWGIGALN